MLRSRFVLPLFGLVFALSCLLGDRSVAGSPVWAQEQHVRPTVNLHGVSFLTPEEGWVVGQLGRVFHTTDGGKRWEEQRTGTNLLLTAVDFVDSSHGWAVGERGTILHSGDGGKSWTSQPSGVSYPLFDVDFLDPQRGWVVGHWGTLLYTEDGGKTWVDRSLSMVLERRGPIEPAAFHDIKDPTSGEVIVKAGDLLTKAVLAELDKRGIGAVRVRDDVVLNGIFFFDQHHGWVVGEQGRIMRTEDGGQTWEKISLPRPPVQGEGGEDEALMSEEELAAFGAMAPLPSLYGVFFSSPQQGWVVGQEGIIARSQDGGHQWEFQPSGVKEALYDVGVANNTGWIAGDKGTVLVSTDGGAQWERKELGLEYRLSWLRRLAVMPGTHSFLIGADGLVLASGESPGHGVWIHPSHTQ